MVTIKEWNKVFALWEERMQNKFPDKIVDGKMSSGRFWITVRDEVKFAFEIGSEAFTTIYIEKCKKEEAKAYGEELLAFLEEQNLSLFVAVCCKETSWYDSSYIEREDMFDEWIPIGEPAMKIRDMLQGITYYQDGDVNQYYLLGEDETLFLEPFCMKFDMKNGDILLTVDTGGDHHICYDVFSEIDSLRQFVEKSKKEKENLQKIKQKIKKMIPEGTPFLEFDCVRKHGDGNYKIVLSVEETMDAICFEELTEEVVIQYLMKAYKMRETKKKVEKEIKQFLFQKDKYGFEYNRNIKLFDGTYVIQLKMYLYLKQEEYKCKIKLTKYEGIKLLGHTGNIEEKEWIGSAEEIRINCEKICKKWLNAKAMEELFSKNNKSHLKKMKLQLMGEDVGVYYTKPTPLSKEEKQEMERLLAAYYKENAEQNGIPLIEHKYLNKKVDVGPICFVRDEKGFIIEKKIRQNI